MNFLLIFHAHFTLASQSIYYQCVDIIVEPSKLVGISWEQQQCDTNTWNAETTESDYLIIQDNPQSSSKFKESPGYMKPSKNTNIKN